MFKFCQNDVITIFFKKIKMKFIFNILIGLPDNFLNLVMQMKLKYLNLLS